MKQIKTKEIDIRVDKYKILCGHEYSKREKFLKQMQASFLKKNTSDYQEEIKPFEYIMINGRDVNIKENVLYTIHPWIDLEDELKLGAKSLFLKHIEVLLMEIDFDEHFLMLKQIIDLFEAESLNAKQFVQLEAVSLKYKLNDLNAKLFSKLIEAQLFKDDCLANPLDLNFEEIVQFITKVINEIAKQHVHLDFWIIVSKKHISNSLIELIESTHKNVRFLVDTERFSTKSLDHIVYFGNSVTDFADPEQCYELMVKQNLEYTTLDEFKHVTQQHIELTMNGHLNLKRL